MDYQDRKKQAFKLRKEGNSYNYISKKTGIAASTMSDWFGKIPYKPNKETIERIGRARAAAGKKRNQQKTQSIKEAEAVAKRDLFMLGLGVYIGEGTKSSGVVRIINADPRIIKLSITWLKDIVGLSDDNFSLRMYLYPDNNEAECKRFWLKQTGLTESSLLSTQIDKRTNKKLKKKNKLK